MADASSPRLPLLGEMPRGGLFEGDVVGAAAALDVELVEAIVVDELAWSHNSHP